MVDTLLHSCSRTLPYRLADGTRVSIDELRLRCNGSHYRTLRELCARSHDAEARRRCYPAPGRNQADINDYFQQDFLHERRPLEWVNERAAAWFGATQWCPSNGSTSVVTVGSHGDVEIAESRGLVTKRSKPAAARLDDETSSSVVLNEARLLARLKGQSLFQHHPNIMHVFDVSTAVASPYVRAEFLPLSVRDALASEQWREQESEAASEARLVSILMDVARGIDALHTADLLHLDVRLDNVRCTTRQSHGYEAAKLIDFSSVTPLHEALSEQGTRDALRRNQIILQADATVSGRQILGRDVDICMFGGVVADLIDAIESVGDVRLRINHPLRKLSNDCRVDRPAQRPTIAHVLGRLHDVLRAEGPDNSASGSSLLHVAADFWSHHATNPPNDDAKESTAPSPTRDSCTSDDDGDRAASPDGSPSSQQQDDGVDVDASPRSHAELLREADDVADMLWRRKSLRVLTFNTKNLSASGSRRDRFDALVTYLKTIVRRDLARDSTPLIVCLQELRSTGSIAELERSLNAFEDSDAPLSPCGTWSVLPSTQSADSKKDYDTVAYWVPPSCEQFTVTHQHWGRVRVGDGWARDPYLAKLRVGRTRFVVISTHLHPDNKDPDRQADELGIAVQELVRRVRAGDGFHPETFVILAGDFNLNCSHPSWLRLLRLGMRPVLPCDVMTNTAKLKRKKSRATTCVNDQTDESGDTVPLGTKQFDNIWVMFAGDEGNRCDVVRVGRHRRGEDIDPLPAARNLHDTVPPEMGAVESDHGAAVWCDVPFIQDRLDAVETAPLPGSLERA